MKKKMFKRRQERHPVKKTLIALGLFALSFISFSAGVQFAELTQDPQASQLATGDGLSDNPIPEARPRKAAHSSGEDV